MLLVCISDCFSPPDVGIAIDHNNEKNRKDRELLTNLPYISSGENPSRTERTAGEPVNVDLNLGTGENNISEDFVLDEKGICLSDKTPYHKIGRSLCPRYFHNGNYSSEWANKSREGAK